MEIRPIRTEDDYQAALREVSACFDQEPEPGSPEGDRFEVMLTLLEAYEAQHFPIDLPDADPPELFAAEARFLLALKLFELGRVSSGKAGRLCGMGRVEFLLAASRAGTPVVNLTEEELAREFVWDD